MREHDTDNLRCACGPDIQKLCPECGGQRCPLCNDEGWVSVTAEQAEACNEVSYVIIHRKDDL